MEFSSGGSYIPTMERSDIITTLTAIAPALRAGGVTHVALFGSRARGDARPDSDVDVLVEVEPRRGFSILDLVGIEHIIRDATGLPANAFMKRSLSDDFLRSISPDAIQVF